MKSQSELKVELGVRLIETATPYIIDVIKKEINIFLIGADIKDKESMRYKVQNSIKHKVNILLPETIFEDQLLLKEYNMLTLENILAHSVDAVVMCIESPGSFTELGAFANHKDLNKKLVVCLNQKYSRAKSFINLGPIKYLKQNTTSIVYSENYTEPFNEKKIDTLLKHIKTVKKKNNQNMVYNLHNPIFSERYVLTLLYIVDSIDRPTLYNIIKQKFSNDKAKKEEIISIIHSSLSSLSYKRDLHFQSRDKTYSLTRKGKNRIHTEYPDHFIHSSLDSLRIEMLNFNTRRPRTYA
ncbi:retron St85 family effector protein [Terribacillus saccharophilus]|uniref:Uncharacterized protein n=1 Tax=Terribacillus saccharophilus TaxID=361277 RepID=A0ABX4GY95_9BACI|nr:retron St85 family effector protein [Terribacillus saccharophilus]PAD35835.1 hypothetical protein CHH56_07455 [Terribacillus saccharophilus]PAD96259.1 hypothetical protein CHH50_09100 [Terribacillus saccharophilus]PAD99834.1 hypothetical protein CHH48_10005 [Terribacillus saccharophilus]